MKQEFEAWVKDQLGMDDDDILCWSERYREYIDERIDWAWRGWLKSRECIKINLPKQRRLEYNSNDNPYSKEVYLMEDDFYEVQELENSLDEAGVNY